MGRRLTNWNSGHKRVDFAAPKKTYFLSPVRVCMRSLCCTCAGTILTPGGTWFRSYLIVSSGHTRHFLNNLALRFSCPPSPQHYATLCPVQCAAPSNIPSKRMYWHSAPLHLSLRSTCIPTMCLPPLISFLSTPNSGNKRIKLGPPLLFKKIDWGFLVLIDLNSLPSSGLAGAFSLVRWSWGYLRDDYIT